MATFDYTLVFTTDTGLTTGTVTLTDVTDWSLQSISPADVEIVWGYKDPLGIDRRLLQVGQSGNIFPAASTSSTVTIPNPGGKVMTGDYTFTYMVVVDGAEGQEVTFVANLCTDLPELCLEDDLQCLTAKLSYRDKTPWTAKGFTVNSRSLVLKYENPAQQADVTSTTAIVTVGPNLFRGQYTVIATWNVTKGNYTTTVTAKKSKDVSCSAGSCKRWCQIKDKFIDWNSTDNGTTKGKIMERLEPMIRYALMADHWEACGDGAMLDVVAKLFDNIAGDCNCNCGCDGESDVIVPVWPSGGGIQDLGISGSEFIIVGEGGEVSLLPAFVTLVNSLRNTEIISSDGSISWSSSTSGITKTFDGAVVKPAPDSIKVLVSFDPANEEFFMSDPQIVGTTFRLPTHVFVGINDSVSRFTDFLVAPLAPGNRWEVSFTDLQQPNPAPGQAFNVNYVKGFDVEKLNSSTDVVLDTALTWGTNIFGSPVGTVIFGWPFITPYYREFSYMMEIRLFTPS